MKELFLRNKTRIGLFVLALYAGALADPGVREFLSSHDTINSFINILNGALISSGLFKSDQFYRDKKAQKEYLQHLREQNPELFKDFEK